MDGLPGLDGAAEREEVPGEGAGDRGGPTLRDGPCLDVSGHQEKEGDGGTDRTGEGEDRVSRAPCKQRTSALAAKPGVPQDGRRDQRRRAEAREEQRVPGQVCRAQHLRDETGGVVEEWADEPAIRGGVR